MKDDFIKELDYLGLTTRLKRISDALMHDGRKMYNVLNVDIEPNWFVIFELLKSYGPMGVTEIAERIRMAHPSVITIVNKMIDAGYLTSDKDQQDSRKRVLSLSDKALKKLPEYEEIWNTGEKVMKHLLEEYKTLEVIASLEEKLFAKGFKDRVMEQLHRNSTEPSHVEIIVFNDDYTSDFGRLNFEWLEKYFYIEPYDVEVLTKPQKYILDEGGQIFIALYKSEVVGTVALIKRGDSRFELSKMAVTEAYQGLHIGKKLMSTCIEYAREQGYTQIYLDSNTILGPAISLYRKTGFKEIPVPKDTPYKRSNIRMVMDL